MESNRLSVVFIILVFLGGLAGCSGNDLTYEGTEEGSNGPEEDTVSDTGDGDSIDDGDGPDASDVVDSTDSREVEETTDPSETTSETVSTCNPAFEPEETAQLVSDVYEQTCSQLFSCGDSRLLAQFFQLGGIGSESDCVSALRQLHGPPEQFRAAVEAERLKLDTCEVSSCLDAVESSSCGKLFRFVQDGDFRRISACTNALVGQRQASDSCTVGESCASGLSCQSSDSVNCGGTCQETENELRGTTCGGNRCGSDQYCDPSIELCRDLKDAGSDCQSSSVCAFDTICQSGSCTEIETGVSEGGACSTRTKLCQPGLICNFSEGQTCRPPVEEGEGCPTGFECKPSLYCDSNNTCQPGKPGGQDCSSDGQCISGTCADGTCLGNDQLCSDL